MNPIVVDASALVEYLLRTEPGLAVGQVIEDGDADLHAPSLCDVEVASVLRRGLLAGRLGYPRASQAVGVLADLPLTRHGHRPLLERVLQLAPNFSAYDATYVALAERLGAALLTTDGPLSRAVRTHVPLELAEPSPRSEPDDPPRG